MSPLGSPFIFFSIFPILFFLVFFLMIGLIIYRFATDEKNRRKNNNSPVLTVNASVVTKRTEISNYRNRSVNSDHMNSSTWYYVTFQVESGDRMELSLSGNEFGMLVEGDYGKLTFQGTRFLKFERE